MDNTKKKEALSLARRLEKIKDMVAEQAEDEGLWVNAETATEAYLQQELRKLHHFIENI